MDAGFAHGLLTIRLDKRCADWPVGRFLVEQLQLPDGFSRKLFALGAVKLGQRTLAYDDPLRAGAKLVLDAARLVPSSRHASVHTAAPEAGETMDASTEESAGGFQSDTQTRTVSVLYEDGHVLVVNKPSGLIIHSDDPAEDTLDRRVAAYLRSVGNPIFALHVHRLDRQTTGAVVYAKHPFIARSLDLQLTSRQMSRTYVAVVAGKPVRTKVIDYPIGRDRHQAGLYRVSSTGKEARTLVKMLHHRVLGDKHLSLLRLQLATGRTHQIRVHTAAIGAPIVGDTQYGGIPSIHAWPKPGQIALHAVRVSFWHPYEERILTIGAPLDEGWRQFLRTEWNIEELAEERT
jgi:23S rRNA pseudouridine1911/1915/1917 synthase